MEGDIVMHFESAKDETFYIPFKDILRIEKDPKSENGIKISLNRYFDSQFYLKSGDRKKLMNEIKKYWRLFLEEKKASAKDEGVKAPFFDSIKKIIFNN